MMHLQPDVGVLTNQSLLWEPEATPKSVLRPPSPRGLWGPHSQSALPRSKVRGFLAQRHRG